VSVCPPTAASYKWQKAPGKTRSELGKVQMARQERKNIMHANPEILSFARGVKEPTNTQVQEILQYDNVCFWISFSDRVPLFFV